MSSHWKFSGCMVAVVTVGVFIIGVIRGRGMSASDVHEDQVIAAILFGVLWLAYQSGMIVSAIISWTKS